MYFTRRLPYLLLILGVVIALASQFAKKTNTAIIIGTERVADAKKALDVHAAIRMAIQDVRDPFPDVEAEGVLVRILESGDTIYARRETESFPIASLTKLMTANLFEEFVPKTEEYVIPSEAKRTIPKISSVPINARISGENILKLMLVGSANDAALIAAEKIGKTVNFSQQLDLDFDNATHAAVSVMNDRAVRLGMSHTNFVNPIGLDDPMQYSSPDDLFILIRYMNDRYPALWHIASQPETSVSFKAGVKTESVIIRNTTPLLTKYPRIIAAKTGTTSEARQALVIIYRLTSEKNVAIILLRSDSRFEDAEKIIHWLDTGGL